MIRVAGEEEGTAVEGERFAACRRTSGRHLQRFERFAERDAIVAQFRRLEPCTV